MTAQIKSVYETINMLEHNTFCSLGLAVTIYLNGVGQQVLFGFD